MQDRTTEEQRITKISAITGLAVGVLAWLLIGFSLVGAIFLALVVALVVAVVLWKRLSPAPDAAADRGAGSGAITTSPPVPTAAPPAGAQQDAQPAVSQSAGSDVRDPEPEKDAPAKPVATHAGHADAAQPLLKPSARLAGQEDLASRKGSWKYDAKNAGASEVDAVPDAPHEPEAHPGTAGTSSIEAVQDQDKPQMLTAPRDGGADDLKKIRGVGPKLEAMLHDMGIYHFDQIAGWSEKEVAWADANLKGFKGRVSRDTWVEQAQILAGGGTTAFSDKVNKGNVY